MDQQPDAEDDLLNQPIQPKRPGMSLRRRLWRAARVLALTYAAIVILAMFFENKLVYHPRKYPTGNWQPSGIKAEDAEFTASDGTRLHGWFVDRQKPRAVVLIAHGNAGNLTDRLHLLDSMRRAGAAALLFDYRGYGKSEGSPTEAGILDDARAARAWLAKRTKVDEQRIVVMGESLGGGVAVDLAAKDGAAGLILLATFTSLPDVAAKVYPWLPVRFLMRNRLDSLAIIGEYGGPVLQCHGDADTIVPYALAEQLFAAVKDPGKRFVTFHGFNHNSLPPGEFDAALRQFFDRLK